MQASTSNPGRKDLRNFGLIMAGMIVLFFGGLIPWIWDIRPWPRWPWLLAGVFATTGLLLPAVLGPVYRAWMKLGAGLGWVNSRIILGIVFYGFVLPMGLVMRLFGKDPMRRKLDSNQVTYRVPSKQPPRDQLERPF